MQRILLHFGDLLVNIHFCCFKRDVYDLFIVLKTLHIEIDIHRGGLVAAIWHKVKIPGITVEHPCRDIPIPM